jgi:hypothetical protein
MVVKNIKQKIKREIIIADFIKNFNEELIKPKRSKNEEINYIKEGKYNSNIRGKPTRFIKGPLECRFTEYDKHIFINGKTIVSSLTPSKP